MNMSIKCNKAAITYYHVGARCNLMLNKFIAQKGQHNVKGNHLILAKNKCEK